jgi:hypothetical protein
MTTSELTRIEHEISRLSFRDQVWLMERLAHRIRQSTEKTGGDRDSLLATMAQDPDIQRELRQIEVEFADTENDGLGTG